MDKLSFLKPLLKVGIKALLPLTGQVIATGMEEAGSLLVDRLQARRSREIHERMLRQMAEDLAWLERLEGIRPARLDSILSTTTRILERHALGLDEWVRRGMDPKVAAEEVLVRAADLRPELDGHDGEQVALRLLISFYTALKADQAALDQTEADFRAIVLAHLQAGEAKGNADVALQSEALLAIPTSPARIDLGTSSVLLRADSAAPVPFHGRKDEIADFLAWCESDDDFGLRLYLGPGGRGKTRLMRHLCGMVQGQGWRAGFLAEEARFARDAHWRRLLETERPLLIVVDYAENRGVEVEATLKGFLRLVPGTRKFRLVLVARGDYDWWQELRRAGGGVGDLVKGPKAGRFPLPPLAMDETARLTSFKVAAGHFAHLLGRPVPDVPDMAWMAPHFEQVLLIHIMALGAVEGADVSAPKWAESDAAPLDWVIDREIRIWDQMASARDLPRDVWPAIRLVMAVLSLGGGALTREIALEVARGVPLLHGQPETILASLVGVLHDAYPGSRWIEPLQPDLLGEHLCQTKLEGHSDREALYDMVFGPSDG